MERVGGIVHPEIESGSSEDCKLLARLKLASQIKAVDQIKRLNFALTQLLGA